MIEIFENVMRFHKELIIAFAALILYLTKWFIDYVLFKKGAYNSGFYSVMKEKQPSVGLGIANATLFIVFALCIYFAWGMFGRSLPEISWPKFLVHIAIFYVMLVIIMNRYTKYILPKYFPDKKWKNLWADSLREAKEERKEKELKKHPGSTH